MVARMVVMGPASVTDATRMDTLRENAVRKRIGVTSATSLAILRKIAPRKMSVTSATRKATWPKTARTRARRPATAAQVKATLPWTVPAARETWTE